MVQGYGYREESEASGEIDRERNRFCRAFKIITKRSLGVPKKVFTGLSAFR